MFSRSHTQQEMAVQWKWLDGTRLPKDCQTHAGNLFISVFIYFTNENPENVLFFNTNSTLQCSPKAHLFRRHWIVTATKISPLGFPSSTKDVAIIKSADICCLFLTSVACVKSLCCGSRQLFLFVRHRHNCVWICFIFIRRLESETVPSFFYHRCGTWKKTLMC